MNVFTKLGKFLIHFSKEERDAQEHALKITTKAKELLESGVVLTIEKVIGGDVEKYAPAVVALVEKLIKILSNDTISKDIEMVGASLGRFGALLTQEMHGRKHPNLRDYVWIFETIFHIKKGK